MSETRPSYKAVPSDQLLKDSAKKAYQMMSKTKTAGKLTFVRWYAHAAVYLNDDLVYFGENAGPHWSLLNALGYECVRGDEVPCVGIPEEFDRVTEREANTLRTPAGWWKPPRSLARLREQFAAWKARQRRERIAGLREELARLEAEAAERPAGES